MNSKEYFLNQAIKQAEKAYMNNEIPIGAVIVDENNKIIGRGYNKKESKQNPLAHAEMIAIKRACSKKKNWRLNNCTLYVTVQPCLMCYGAIVESRIQKVYFGCHSLYVNTVNAYSEDKQYKQITNFECLNSNKCLSILKKFFEQKR